MESYILIPILLVLVFSLATNIALFIMFARNIRAFHDTFYAFVTPKKAGEKSGLDAFIDHLSYNIGHAAFTQVRSMAASSKSAEVRGERAVDAAISEDLLKAANPVVGGLLDSLPGLKKVISRNPGLADYALEKIMSRAMATQPQPGTTPAGDNGSSSTRIEIT